MGSVTRTALAGLLLAAGCIAPDPAREPMEAFETRPCLRCEKVIEEISDANACTHACTFCNACTQALEAVCPNCSGKLEPLSGTR